MSEIVKVWLGGFIGASADGLSIEEVEGIKTEKRVKLVGRGTFGSDIYLKPTEVNYTLDELLDKLQKQVDDTREYGEWQLAKADRMQRALSKRREVT